MAQFIGRKIDHYAVEALLGSGGMGAVYRAVDTKLNRPIALKIIHPHLAKQDTFRDRFLREAQAIAQLDHPSIIKIYDYGETFDYEGGGDIAYLVTEFVSGGSLADRQGVDTPVRNTLHLLAQVADALDYAHKRNIIHRDIKPDNILLKPLDHGDFPVRAIITDLGLAKLTTGSQQTATGTMLGTWSYLSPEQCLGEAVDGRTDLYALGVVLFEQVVGRVPFAIETPAQAVAKHVYEPITIPASVPDSIATIIKTALAKNPEERYASGAVMAAALREVANATPQQTVVQTPPASAVISPPIDTDRVSANTPVTMTLDAPNVNVLPGGTVRVTATLLNQSTTVRHFDVSVSGIPAEWVTVQQPQVRLMPGGKAQVGLTLHPPRHALASAETHTYQLSAAQAGIPSTTIAGNVTIMPFQQFRLEARPSRLTQAGVCRVTVANEGNAVETFTVAAVDPAEQLEFDPEQTQLAVAPHGEEVVGIEVRPKKRPIFTYEAPHPFEIRVANTTGERRSERGQLTVKPLIPRWARALLVVVMLALVGFLVLDVDGDGLNVIIEIRVGTSPFSADSDNDGIRDGDEDADGDGLTNQQELDINTNPARSDSDGDGIDDGEEDADRDTIPNIADTSILVAMTPTPWPTELPPTETPTPTATPTATPTPTPTLTPLPTPPDQDLYNEDDPSVLWLVERYAVYEQAVADNATWLLNPLDVAKQIAGIDTMASDTAGFYETGADTMTIVLADDAVQDDSISAEEIRVDLEREDDRWYVEWAGRRYKCWRGENRDWVRGLCP